MCSAAEAVRPYVTSVAAHYIKLNLWAATLVNGRREAGTSANSNRNNLSGAVYNPRALRLKSELANH